MGQAFITRRGNNYGFKRLPEPILMEYGTAKKLYSCFPTSLFENIAYYIVIAQYRDQNGNIIPLHQIFQKTEDGEVKKIGSCYLSYTGGLDLISTMEGYIGASMYESNTFDWTFEKGFIYEYK